MEGWQLATSGNKFRHTYIYINFPFVVCRLARLAKTKHFTIFRDYIYCLFFEPYLSLKYYFSISSSFLHAAFLMVISSALMGKWLASNQGGLWVITSQVFPSPLYPHQKIQHLFSQSCKRLWELVVTSELFSLLMDFNSSSSKNCSGFICSLNYLVHHSGLLFPLKQSFFW